jgi:hypothetical protein
MTQTSLDQDLRTALERRWHAEPRPTPTVKNCYMKGRGDEIIFSLGGDEIIPILDGYSILPVEILSWEDANSLVNGSKVLTPAQAPDKAGEREGLAELIAATTDLLNSSLEHPVGNEYAEHPDDNDKRPGDSLGKDIYRARWNLRDRARKALAAVARKKLDETAPEQKIQALVEAVTGTTYAEDAVAKALYESEHPDAHLWPCHCAPKTMRRYLALAKVASDALARAALAALTPSAPTAAPVRDDGARAAELRRELTFFVSSVKALMRHTNPTNVNEGHAQQWFAVSDAIRMKIEPLIASLPAPAGDVPGEAQTQEGGR